jgi:spore germination protein
MLSESTPPRPGSRRARAERRRRRLRRPALLAIIVFGIAAVAGAFLVARALDHERPHGPYLIGAWTFGNRESLSRAVKAGAIDEVSADWLQSRRDGSVIAPLANRAFMDEVRKQDCKLFVTLTDYNQATQSFDPAISDAILATAENRHRHVMAVAAWCAANKVAGVDVDWEALTARQRTTYSLFIEELAATLHHDGRLIAVDVYPKVSEPGTWDGPRSQDWQRLGRAVDEFRVMTYNYSGAWSGAGPLSPPGWMEKVIVFAGTLVEPRKIVMGLGFYGRDWRGSHTTDLIWSDVQRIRAQHSPLQNRGASRELVLRYRRSGTRHTAYFPDATAMNAKLTVMLARHPHIRGVYCWMLGQEDPAVWDVLRKRLH